MSTDHAWWRPEAPCELDEGLYDLWDLTVENLLPYDCGTSGFGANYKNTICKMYPRATCGFFSSHFVPTLYQILKPIPTFALLEA